MSHTISTRIVFHASEQTWPNIKCLPAEGSVTHWSWISQLCSVSFLTVSYLRPSALHRIHQQSYSFAWKRRWKLREEMLALLLINCSQTNFSPSWKSLDRSRQCLKNISVSVTGHFLKSSQLETRIGLKRDVAKKDRSPHLFFLFLKDPQHTPATAMCVKVYLREPAYLSNKASNATVLLPDSSGGFAWALWQLREGDTNTHKLQEFYFRWDVTLHLV